MTKKVTPLFRVNAAGLVAVLLLASSHSVSASRIPFANNNTSVAPQDLPAPQAEPAQSNDSKPVETLKNHDIPRDALPPAKIDNPSRVTPLSFPQALNNDRLPPDTSMDDKERLRVVRQVQDNANHLNKMTERLNGVSCAPELRKDSRGSYIPYSAADIEKSTKCVASMGAQIRYMMEQQEKTRQAMMEMQSLNR